MQLTSRVFFLAVSVALGSVAVPRSAHAQDDKAGAQVLLDAAVKLTKAGDFATACHKLEESGRLFPSINTKYFLADCYEHVGRLASAWIIYLEVASIAQAAGDHPKQKRALERAASIESKMSRLVVQVADRGISGISVQRDGQPVGDGQWGVPMPVDGGEHVVEAAAPGYAPVRVKVTVKTQSDLVEITVPSLTALPSTPKDETPASDNTPTRDELEALGPPRDVTPPRSPAPPPPRSVGGWTARRISGITLSALGVSAMGVAGIVALGAKSSYKAAPGCSGTLCDDQTGLDARNRARAQGNAATVVFVIGSALVVGGGVLWLTAPVPKSASAATTRVGVGPGSIALERSF